ncbi:MAG: fibronectin type III domain-containing protein [bacterium]
MQTGSTGTTHTITLDGLTDNTTYNYRVFATTATATGDLSATGTFTTPKIITTDNVT